jgi:hypothetical protein
MPVVKLIDGREVDSSSEAWRRETEAREVLSWPKHRRLEFLNGGVDIETGRKKPGVLQHRGPTALEQLKADILALWQRNR